MEPDGLEQVHTKKGDVFATVCASIISILWAHKDARFQVHTKKGAVSQPFEASACVGTREHAKAKNPEEGGRWLPAPESTKIPDG